MKLYPLYLKASSLQFRSCFPRVPHFQISYLSPVLSIAVLYFYMSFACSPSLFSLLPFTCWRCAAVHEHPHRRSKSLCVSADLSTVSESIWCLCRNTPLDWSGGKNASDFYLPSFASLYFWRIHTVTSLFGTVSPPPTPPGWGWKPFPVETE